MSVFPSSSLSSFSGHTYTTYIHISTLIHYWTFDIPIGQRIRNENFKCRFQGFFRRTISNQLAYRQCPKNGTCKILRMNRNRCQFCRFKKCMEVGMSRDSVKYGRIPKKQKARMIQDRKEQWWDPFQIWPLKNYPLLKILTRTWIKNRPQMCTKCTFQNLWE